MFTKVAHIALAVRDVDEALAFYTEKLGFAKIHDTQLAPDIRWVAVAPDTDSETLIRFEEASNEEEQKLIGRQLTNMLVAIETSDFDQTYRDMKERGVEFVEEAVSAPWGKQAVFQDLYGNLFDLLEKREA
jgi:catechol 2,3-dioxygenase-like lactoylglutathione lyase family enzyme